MRKMIFLAALALAGCGSWFDETKNHQYLYQSIAIDGDTFEAGPAANRSRYRLARIDAPELPGHCREGRRCVEGDPEKSKAALQYFLNRNPACKVVGRDVYRRKLAECMDGGMDSSINDMLVALGFAEEYRR
jgi:micrococcal nuclease